MREKGRGGRGKGKREKYDQRQRWTSVKKYVWEFPLQLKMKLNKGRQTLANKDDLSQTFFPDDFHFSPVNRS